MGKDLQKKEKLKEMDKKLRVFKLRVAKVAGGTSSKLGRIRVVRKSIAKYLTVINEKNRNDLKATFKNKSEKKKPYSIRAKRTRAIRKALSKHQKNLKTVRATKQAKNFPARKFTLRAD